MKKPNFFIVGGPKCGTTALSEYLKQHPGVFMTTPKEPHFFADDFPMYKDELPDLDAYLKLFSRASSRHKALGEASVYYLYSEIAIENISKIYSDSKLIVMLRNPIEVVQSLHSQLIWTLDEDIENLEEAWCLIEERKSGGHVPELCRDVKLLDYSEIAMFGAQIERLRRFFPEENVKYVFYEDFAEFTEKTYLSTLAFLGLSQDSINHFPVINQNKTHRSKLLARLLQRPPNLLVALAEYYKRVMKIEQLGLLRKVRRLNNSTLERKQISEDFRRTLSRHYSEDIDCLASLTGRNLDHWKFGVSV